MSTLTARLTPEICLPADGEAGTLLARVWLPHAGPALVTVRDGMLIDITAAGPTSSDIMENADPRKTVTNAEGPVIGALADVLSNSAVGSRDAASPHFLAPVDLQVIKAGGVTFMTSLMERVIEEQARGDASRADDIRQNLSARIGTDLGSIKPGSDAAMRLKDVLIDQGIWSQYLEVGIGPDAEVFTKTAVLAAVGLGADVGIHPKSSWNNPEPEAVLVVSSAGQIVGAMLGNDVNLRDFEGRSALLLSKAKDNNGSCALGPFIRLFDDSFSLDDVRQAEIALTVTGEDGFVLDGKSSMSEISRDPEDLVAQTINRNHQYPDGFVLFTGTMFAPVKDRGAPGEGFTHKEGDIVTISSPKLGGLTNRVRHSDAIAPWQFGVRALMKNLAGRGLL